MQEKSAPPNHIFYKGKNVTSPKQIAEIANNFFIEKIETIRSKFKPDLVKPLDILGKLIPRIEDEFYIPNITIRQTLELLRNCKGSNSTGYDDINSKF